MLLGHIDRPGLQPHQFGILVGDDVEHHGVEVRQWLASLVPPPVVRVAFEGHSLAGLIGGQPERSHADDLGRRGRDRPGLREVPARQRRFQPVFGQDDEVVEQADARTERLRKGDDDRGRVRRLNGDRLSVHRQGNGQLALGKERLRRLHREGDVGRAERLSVRPAEARDGE